MASSSSSSSLEKNKASRKFLRQVKAKNPDLFYDLVQKAEWFLKKDKNDYKAKDLKTAFRAELNRDPALDPTENPDTYGIKLAIDAVADEKEDATDAKRLFGNTLDQVFFKEENISESNFYHITKKDNLSSIKKYGILPKKNKEMANEPFGIFLFTSKNDAEDAVVNWLGDRFDEEEELVMLTLDSSYIRDIKQSIAGYEVYTENPIDPQAIKNIMLLENIDVDINIGDTVLGGRFKNKSITVKKIGKDELNQPTINDRPLLKYRIKKDMPEKKSLKETYEEELLSEEEWFEQGGMLRLFQMGDSLPKDLSNTPANRKLPLKHRAKHKMNK